MDEARSGGVCEREDEDVAEKTEWQLRDQAREEARRRLEDQGIYGATTQLIEQEADKLMARPDDRQG